MIHKLGINDKMNYKLFSLCIVIAISFLLIINYLYKTYKMREGLDSGWTEYPNKIAGCDGPGVDNGKGIPKVEKARMEYRNNCRGSS